MKHDKYHGDGLTQLADPEPDEWLTDTSQVMQSTTGEHAERFGPTYGNFWSERLCVVFPHGWKTLRVTDADTGYPRPIQRCQRCGSQIHTLITVIPPRRGERFPAG